jgi:8-oxo-dGTP diphosphatase
VYLQKRSQTAEALPGYFGFWGGGAEGEESAEQVLIREIQEEMGITIDVKVVELFNRYEFLRSVKYVYLYKAEQGWERQITIGEGDYGQWFSTDEAIAKNDIILEDKVILNDLERRLLGKSIR